MNRNIDIYPNFKGKWFKKANEYYIAKESAIDFVEYLNDQNIRILGIDGFAITDKLTKPLLNYIYDYSSHQPRFEDIKSDLKIDDPKVTHFNFTFENKAPKDLYFVCSDHEIINNVNQPKSLIQIKTKIPNTHIAFSTDKLANEVIKFLNVPDDIYIIKNDEITEDISYRLNPGYIVLFNNTEEVELYNSDRSNFPYFDYVVEYNHPFKSKWDNSKNSV